MNIVEFKNVSRKFGRTVIADDMALAIRERSFSVIFGAPATGKSTLLRLITGLERPDNGDIFLRGENMKGVKPGDRNIGYVPQSFALYPHYKVKENIAYPLKLMGAKDADVKPVVERTAEQLKIGHLLEKMPDQCSGGEKQRVAIARGIVKRTEIFILDDPLTGLDFKLREQLFDDLRQMQLDLNATFIYTTSDTLEALMLAEDIHIFDGGKIIEAGELEAVYSDPQHVRTMALLGYPEANILTGQLAGGQCETPLLTFLTNTNGANGEVYVALRPQHININPKTSDGLLTLPAEVTLIEDLGGELLVYLNVQNTLLEAVANHNEVDALTEGPAQIGVRPHDLTIYATDSNTHIGQGVD
jgi:ABC-type sugar transport system ATPase subunit